jgi:hypothetical protein
MEIHTLSKIPLWDVMRANYISLGKEFGEDDYLKIKDPEEKWRNLLLAEHSTLEFVPFIVSGEFRSDVISHLVRHTKGHPRFVCQSARTDWTGKERPGPEALRKFSMLWNPISWIAMCRQRLCSKAMRETKDAVYAMLREMSVHPDSFFRALASLSMAECRYRGGCPYGIRSCGAHSHILLTSGARMLGDVEEER